MVIPFTKITTTELMPCKQALSGLSQVPNFFVICFYHRITMQKNKCLELGNLALPEFMDLPKLSAILANLK